MHEDDFKSYFISRQLNLESMEAAFNYFSESVEQISIFLLVCYVWLRDNAIKINPVLGLFALFYFAVI